MIENLNIQHPEAEDLKHDEFYKDKVFDWTPSDICEGKSNINFFVQVHPLKSTSLKFNADDPVQYNSK